MFGLFKKKKEPYLERVASILHQTIGPTLPLENAYNLAEECLQELRSNISRGMFQDGANPRENIMAYYSLCSMVNESSASDDKMDVLKISIMAQLLKEKLGEFESMSSLEKGIWQFGEQALSEGSGTYTKGDIEKIRSDAVQIIMDLMREQEVTASRQDVVKIVKNVSSNIGDKEVSKVGEKVLAVSVLSNATGYYIDQGGNDLAHSYFMCIGAAIRMHFEGQMDSYSEHQSKALSMIMQDHRSLGEELMTNSNEPFENITKETNISMDDIGSLLQSDTNNIAKIHSGAKNGNLTCQIFLSQMELIGLTKYANDPSISHEKITQMQTNFENYTKLAAEQDDVDSQFNLAKNYLMKVDISKGTLNEDDLTNLESAKYWYEKANFNGHENTEEIILTLNELLSNTTDDDIPF